MFRAMLEEEWHLGCSRSRLKSGWLFGGECAMYVCGGGSQCSWGDTGLLGTVRESKARPFPAPSPKT